MSKANTLVIIGNSAAGVSCIESIRQSDKTSKIINISREPYERPYSRCLLSYYLAGSINKDRVWIRPKLFYKDLNVEPILGAEVSSIDEKSKKIKLSGNKSIDYDKLLFSTGASAKRLTIKGVDKKGVFCLRTLEDADGILSMIAGVKDVAILGGGLIGLRVAHSLSKLGKNVHVIVKSSHLLSQMLDFESADMIRRNLEANGIKIMTGLEAVEILGKDKVEGLTLDDGNKLESQLVIIGKGVSPNIDLLKEKVKIEEGILIDKNLRTSNPDIYAAGDAAQGYDIVEEKQIINAIWPAAIRQGKLAGLNMIGKSIDYEGFCGMNSVDFFGMSCISFGIVKSKKDGFEELIQADFSKGIYRKVMLRDNKIVGAVFVNDIERHGILLHLALQRIDVSDIKDILADEVFDYGKVVPLIQRQKDKFKRPEYEDTCSTYGRCELPVMY